MAFDVGSIVGHAYLDTKGWTSGEKTLNSSFSKIKIGIAALGTAIIGGLAASVKIANDFNKEFANVTTLVDTSKVSISAMRQELLGLDARLGSSIDLTKGLYQTLSAGVDAGKAVEFVGTSAKFAKAALTDTNTAVDVITTALNAYGMEADKASNVSDIFFETIKQGKITGQQLATSIGDVIPSAASLGISLEELGASLATMTKQGINSSEATTQLNAIMTAFLKPSQEMEAALKKMGIESGSALIEAEGLTGALKFLEESTGGNKEELAALLPNVRAFKGAIALTGQQAETYNETLEKMKTSTGATNEAFEKQQLTFETLKNSIEKIAIKVGNALLPTIYELTENITEFVNSSTGMETLANAVAGIAAAFAVAKDIVMDLVTPLKESLAGIAKTLTTSFEKLSKSTGKTVKAWDILAGLTKLVGIGFRIVGKTVELVIEGIADLIIAITQSGKTISSFFDFLTGKASWKEVKENAKATGDAFKNLALNVGENFGEIINTVTDEFSKLPKEVESLSGKITNSWDKVFEGTKNSIKSGLTDIQSDIQSNLEEIIGEGNENILSNTEETTSNWKDLWSEAVRLTMEDLKIFEEGMNRGFEIVGYFINSVGQALNEIANLTTMAMDKELTAIQQQGQEKLKTLETNKAIELASEKDKYDKEMAMLDSQLEKNRISEENYRKSKTELEKKYNKNIEDLEAKHNFIIEQQQIEQQQKENEQKKKAFETKKNFDIANVWITFASGVMAAWTGAFAALGGIPVVGPALAITMAGLMSGILLGTALAQTMFISQQKFIPSAATGAEVQEPGLIKTDEAGGEIKKYNKGDIVIPNDISRQIANNIETEKNNQTFNISFAGANIKDDMSLKKVTDHVIREIGRRVKFA